MANTREVVSELRKVKENAREIKLPNGVTMEMVEAGMREWDKRVKADERSWPEMLGHVFAVMENVKNEQRPDTSESGPKVG
jgi:hypothetical protein